MTPGLLARSARYGRIRDRGLPAHLQVEVHILHRAQLLPGTAGKVRIWAKLAANLARGLVDIPSKWRLSERRCGGRSRRHVRTRSCSAPPSGSVGVTDTPTMWQRQHLDARLWEAPTQALSGVSALTACAFATQRGLVPVPVYRTNLLGIISKTYVPDNRSLLHQDNTHGHRDAHKTQQANVLCALRTFVPFLILVYGIDMRYVLCKWSSSPSTTRSRNYHCITSIYRTVFAGRCS